MWQELLELTVSPSGWEMDDDLSEEERNKRGVFALIFRALLKGARRVWRFGRGGLGRVGSSLGRRATLVKSAYTAAQQRVAQRLLPLLARSSIFRSLGHTVRSPMARRAIEWNPGGRVAARSVAQRLQGFGRRVLGKVTMGKVAKVAVETGWNVGFAAGMLYLIDYLMEDDDLPLSYEEIMSKIDEAFSEVIVELAESYGKPSDSSDPESPRVFSNATTAVLQEQFRKAALSILSDLPDDAQREQWHFDKVREATENFTKARQARLDRTQELCSQALKSTTLTGEQQMKICTPLDEWGSDPTSKSTLGSTVDQWRTWEPLLPGHQSMKQFYVGKTPFREEDVDQVKGREWARGLGAEPAGGNPRGKRSLRSPLGPYQPLPFGELTQISHQRLVPMAGDLPDRDDEIDQDNPIQPQEIEPRTGETWQDAWNRVLRAIVGLQGARAPGEPPLEWTLRARERAPDEVDTASAYAALRRLSHNLRGARDGIRMWKFMVADELDLLGIPVRKATVADVYRAAYILSVDGPPRYHPVSIDTPGLWLLRALGKDEIKREMMKAAREGRTRPLPPWDVYPTVAPTPWACDWASTTGQIAPKGSFAAAYDCSTDGRRRWAEQWLIYGGWNVTGDGPRAWPGSGPHGIATPDMSSSAAPRGGHLPRLILMGIALWSFGYHPQEALGCSAVGVGLALLRGAHHAAQPELKNPLDERVRIIVASGFRPEKENLEQRLREL